MCSMHPNGILVVRIAMIEPDHRQNLRYSFSNFGGSQHQAGVDVVVHQKFNQIFMIHHIIKYYTMRDQNILGTPRNEMPQELICPATSYI
ncbi:hypothetical protein AGMMS49983_13010 [Clostridia bacterium]|nr:hypothetical protein AGMMS49983_13010 [Clostridia bacterium]